MKDKTSLSEDEIGHVGSYLRGLSRTLQAKKGIGSPGKLLSEEETVMNAIQTPARGDLQVFLVPAGKTSFEIFIQNPREADNPFSIMNLRDHGRNPGRRRLNTSNSELKENEFALFLSSVQDRENFRILQNNIVRGFTVDFTGVDEDRKEQITPTVPQDLSKKPLASCTENEKWEIYKQNSDFDARVSEIAKEMFRLPIMYAKYKQAVKQEELDLEPGKFQPAVNQMIRDIYPSNIRPVLKKDFPKEHVTKLKEVNDILQSVKNKLTEKISGSKEEGPFRTYLKECLGYIVMIIEKDPDLLRIA